jgi:hypothetical protein
MAVFLFVYTQFKHWNVDSSVISPLKNSSNILYDGTLEGSKTLNFASFLTLTGIELK